MWIIFWSEWHAGDACVLLLFFLLGVLYIISTDSFWFKSFMLLKQLDLFVHKVICGDSKGQYGDDLILIFFFKNVLSNCMQCFIWSKLERWQMNLIMVQIASTYDQAIQQELSPRKAWKNGKNIPNAWQSGICLNRKVESTFLAAR